MRKLYALLASIWLLLAATPSIAQNPPVANFTFTVSASGHVNFTNTSVVDTTQPYWGALWVFGDGNTQHTNVLGGAMHQYSSAGTYTACLKILHYVNTTSEPVVAAQVCKTIVIGSVCSANFEKDSVNAYHPLSASFHAIPWHSNQNKPVYICWTFGDGRDTCIQYSNTYPGPYNVSHNYNSSGNYQVCVRMVYQGGCEATYCRMIQLANSDSCRADFERLPVTSSSNLVMLKALPWHNNNKKPSRICWTFGDGRDTCINYGPDYGGSYTVNHIYPNNGQYNVCVMINYFGGCEASKCRTIEVISDSCRANFERIPDSTNNQLDVLLKAIPWHTNDRSPVRICWNFGDGQDTCINYSTSYNGPYTIAHTYSQPGNYQVCVSITYFLGCVATICKPIQIHSTDTCRADFERIPLSYANHPLNATFKALPWHHEGKKPSKICWNFGDGRDTCINYGQDYTGLYLVNHTYANQGTYNACVKITYYGGCEASKCRTIVMARPDSCAANFERIPTTTSNNTLTTSFRALIWHNNNKKPSKICWYFGDGRDTCINYGPDYTGQYIVNHTYTQPGEYQVCVKITYHGGCEAHKCERVNVPYQQCHVQLHQLSTSAISHIRGFYASTYSIPPRRIERICWNFGDGQDTCINATATDSVSRYISHAYPGPGVYRACVKVFFEGGCTATDCQHVEIRSYTDLCGGYMTDSLVAPRTFKFRGFAIHKPNDEVLSYRWTFGDGTSALGRDVTHTYSTSGDFRVCLTILTRSGCETKICNTVRIPGNNVPRLVITPNPVINVMHVQFNSTHMETVTLRIINSTGVIIRTMTRPANAGVNNWDFDVANLLPGYYSLVVQSANQYSSAFFLKQ